MGRWSGAAVGWKFVMVMARLGADQAMAGGLDSDSYFRIGCFQNLLERWSNVVD